MTVLMIILVALFGGMLWGGRSRWHAQQSYDCDYDLVADDVSCDDTGG